MNNMIKPLNIEYIAICLLSALLIGFSVLRIKKRKDIAAFFARADIRNRIKELILLVEKDMNSEEGYARLWRVCAYIWSFIPPSLKPFVTVEMLCNVVQTIFDLLAERKDGHTVPVDKEIN